MCRTSETEKIQKDLKAIEKLHETDWAASKTFDIETLISLWTDDGVLLQPGQEPLVGKEAIMEYLQSELRGPRHYEILEYYHDFQEIRICGDWAFEWGTFHGKIRMLADGEESSQTARLLRILRNEPDGSWKCARAISHAR